MSARTACADRFLEIDVQIKCLAVKFVIDALIKSVIDKYLKLI